MTGGRQSPERLGIVLNLRNEIIGTDIPGESLSGMYVCMYVFTYACVHACMHV